MATTVTDSNASLYISNGGETIRVPKGQALVKNYGTTVEIIWGSSNQQSYKDDYTNFTDPSGASATIVANAIEALLDPGSVVSENVAIYGTDGSGNVQISVDATGKVNVIGTDLTNISTNTSNTAGSVSTIASTVFADNGTFTPSTSKVLVVAAEVDDTSPVSGAEGKAGALRMSTRRELYIQIRDAAGNERGLNIDASGNIAAVLAAGTANAGMIGANASPSVSITRPANVTQYAVNDVMNNTTDTVPLIFSVASANNKRGWVIGGTVISSNGAAGTLPQIDLLLFSSTFTIAADNAAFAPTYAQMQTLLGRLRFNQFVNRGGISASPGSVETVFPFVPASGTTNIYGVALLQNTYTPASAETLQFVIFVEQY